MKVITRMLPETVCPQIIYQIDEGMDSHRFKAEVERQRFRMSIAPQRHMQLFITKYPPKTIYALERESQKTKKTAPQAGGADRSQNEVKVKRHYRQFNSSFVSCGSVSFEFCD